MVDTDPLKRSRSSAKGQFTKAKNNIIRVMNSNSDIEIIENRWADLKRTFSNVQEKHADYVSALAEEEPVLQTEEEWIENVDRDFDEIESKKVSYVRKKDKEKLEEVKPVTGQSIGMQQQCHSMRKMEEATFNSILSSLELKLEAQMEADEPILDIIKDELTDLKRQLDVCKHSHSKYVETLTQIPETEITWVSVLQEKVLKMNTKLSSLTTVRERKKRSGIRLERIKMPTFDGNIRDYPRFKSDFTRQVLPEYKSDEHAAAYTLKSCLSKEPLNIIRNVDDDLTEMWKRLDDKYGKASKFTDAVMTDIKKMRVVREGDDRKFVELVHVVESGFRDLERLKLDKEISNSTAVSIIEDKLPRDIRRLWALEISKTESSVDDADKFPSLLQFLLEQKRAIEYDTDKIRTPTYISGGASHFEKLNISEQYDGYDENGDSSREVFGGTNYFEQNKLKNPVCVIHNASDHSTRDCREYSGMTPAKKIEVVRNSRLCFSCLSVGHRSTDCNTRRRCGIDNCTKFHHNSLHQGSVEGLNFHSLGITENSRGACMLQLMSIKSSCKNVKPLTVFFDGGATISLITFSKAAMLGLNGTEITLTVTKVGGVKEKLRSYQYVLPLVDKKGEVVEFEVYGIDKISTEVQSIDVEGVIKLFSNVRKEEILRPVGEIDVLIGFEYAGYHPVREQSSNHLLVMQNRFGRCLGGFHKTLCEGTRKLVQHVTIHHLRQIKVDDFYNIESMGVNCNPRCGGCKCGHCPLGGKSYTLKEERELKLIEEGLEHKGNHWVARYPWLRSPFELPDNYSSALARLKGLERRLLRNPEHCKTYQQQINDMISRKVAHKLTSKELEEYKGPVYYIAHHEVWKHDSTSTPCRIVFDSSGKFGDYVLNNFWAKGPDLINNLLGILLRFREGHVAMTGDIRKMYHSIKTGSLDQHTHRFLWRDVNPSIEPSTYVMSSVSFGDRPSGNIAIVALRKTAEMGKDEYPEAANIILRNTYVDDVVDSLEDVETAHKRAQEIDKLIKTGGFQIKKWSFSSNTCNRGGIQSKVAEIRQGVANGGDNVLEKGVELNKILGMKWNSELDVFKFDVHLNFSPKHRKIRTGPDLCLTDISAEIPLTKRMILSQINGIYDPLGLAGPFTVRAKILMRQLWSGSAKPLGWDDTIPELYQNEWITFFRDLFEIEEISFWRCIKPMETVGNPSLVVFSDGSNDAFGSCAYARWMKIDDTFESCLIASKNRLTPLRRITTVRSELCGAVLAKRLKTFIQDEMRLEFDEEYFIVDSQIVRAMIQKESYGFNTFAAVRIGEIQEKTYPKDWYWVESKSNISDWLTRGKTPKDLREDSLWQRGMDFMKLPVSQWPLRREQPDEELPEQVKFVMKLNGQIDETLLSRIDINRFSSYRKLIRVTARVLNMYQKEPKLTFGNVCNELEPADIKKAEIAWFIEAQSVMKENQSQGGMRRLYPVMREDGVVVVKGRVENWFKYRYDDEELVVLPYSHRLSRLFAEYTHTDGGHLGVAATVSKIRLRVWIPKIRKMVQSIRFHCVFCKKRNKLLQEQRMATLPIERLKPAPAWCFTSLDFFGPIEVRGEVNKRSRGKAYGVLFNCLVSRAVYVDVAADYTTEGFLLVLRRFISLRGYPSKIFSDPGSQLVAASKELKGVIKGLDVEQLKQFGVEKGLEWKFSPADGPWQNGCSEALVKSVKKAIVGSIGAQVLTVTEMQTVCFEAANLVNERPIGRHPTDPSDGTYLSPNHLLLGRATTRVPSGPFETNSRQSKRYSLVQSIANSFWRQWTRDFFPSLLVHQKWHTQKRNVKIGDIVLVQDSKQVRGNWKLAGVSNVFPSDDGLVRKVELQYKNERPGEPKNKYSGVPYTKIERPVQKIVIIVPVDDDGQTINDDVAVLEDREN